MSPPRPPFAPAAVVFDLDGLLVDTEDAWGRAERRVVEATGKPWDEAIRPLLLGRGAADAARLLDDYIGAGLGTEEVRRRLRRAAAEELDRGVALQPGADALLSALSGRVLTAIATNTERVLAEVILARAGLHRRVDAIVTADDVRRPKPAPDLYEAAATAVGADPRRCVALEDSPVGATAAKTAGMWVIGCPTDPDSALDAADVIVADLGAVDAAALLGREGSG